MKFKTLPEHQSNFMMAKGRIHFTVLWVFLIGKMNHPPETVCVWGPKFHSISITSNFAKTLQKVTFERKQHMHLLHFKCFTVSPWRVQHTACRGLPKNEKDTFYGLLPKSSSSSLLLFLLLLFLCHWCFLGAFFFSSQSFLLSNPSCAGFERADGLNFISSPR